MKKPMLGQVNHLCVIDRSIIVCGKRTDLILVSLSKETVAPLWNRRVL